jgi:ribosomal-protein-alanine N-acetyltransferase
VSAVLSTESFPAPEFKALREADLARVAAIEANVYVFPWSVGNFRDSLFAGYECSGCWVGDELVGYAIVMSAVDEAHLLNIAVASEWQGRGIGSLFLRWLIESARKRALEMMYLEVRPSNSTGRHLYHRFGFKQLGLRRDYYPAVTGREDALFLGLNLSER